MKFIALISAASLAFAIPAADTKDKTIREFFNGKIDEKLKAVMALTKTTPETVLSKKQLNDLQNLPSLKKNDLVKRQGASGYQGLVSSVVVELVKQMTDPTHGYYCYFGTPGVFPSFSCGLAYVELCNIDTPDSHKGIHLVANQTYNDYVIKDLETKCHYCDKKTACANAWTNTASTGCIARWGAEFCNSFKIILDYCPYVTSTRDSRCAAIPNV
jgi:hypothetical protein